MSRMPQEFVDSPRRIPLITPHLVHHSDRSLMAAPLRPQEQSLNQQEQLLRNYLTAIYSTVEHLTSMSPPAPYGTESCATLRLPSRKAR